MPSDANFRDALWNRRLFLGLSIGLSKLGNVFGCCIALVCACNNAGNSQGAVAAARSQGASTAVVSTTEVAQNARDAGAVVVIRSGVSDGAGPVSDNPAEADGGIDAAALVRNVDFAEVADVACDDYRTAKWAKKYMDRYGNKRTFGYHGYLYREVLLQRSENGKSKRHCVRVYFPGGDTAADGKRVRMIDYVRPSWFRLIYNTLQRLPWSHVQVVRAMVIDDRPSLHGVASFSREKPKEDARDGHTIWLNKRLFLQPNGTIRGNFGTYWGYRVHQDNSTLKSLDAEHDYFSPVLLHELGHLMMYNRVNGNPADVTCPPCAHMCGDKQLCDKMSQYEKELDCVTPYCTGFGFSSGTENFAEMYRWYYQSSITRDWLKQHFGGCYELLNSINEGAPAPWDQGLPQVSGYVPSNWNSCKSGKANKANKDWAGRCIASDLNKTGPVNDSSGKFGK